MNREFARLLYQIAEIKELEESQWKAQAYRSAALSIENMDEELDSVYKRGGKKGLLDIPGVGDHIATYIIEYIGHGHVKKFDELLAKHPGQLNELTKIEWIGPKRAKQIAEILGVKTIRELKTAIDKGRLRKIPGITLQRELEMRKSIEFHEKGGGRMLLRDAYSIARTIITYLKEHAPVDRIDYAGSLRRMKETVGDIDLLATSKDAEKVIDAFISMPKARVVTKGLAKSTIKLDNVQVDILVLPDESYGAALQYFTGSKDHNVALRNRAIKKGYKLSEHGLFERDTGKRIACETEEIVYRSIGLPYIPPELRENRGELEAAEKRKLPHLIEMQDIKGDLHIHTNFSDGKETVETMVVSAQERGYEYIAITDHSPSQKIARGLDEGRLKDQWKQIDRAARKHKLAILKGSEVDILKDGSLDYPEAILRKLDVVVGSIHSHFTHNVTERILAALENEHLDILGHPTGRLIGKRDAYAVDMQRVFRAAADRNKILEINAQPLRLDLKDIHIMQAKEHGIRFAINTDSHYTYALSYMRYGVAQARRGWLTKDDVVNTLPLAQLKKLL